MSTDPATGQEQTPIDPAEVMAAHQCPPKGSHCVSCGTGYPGDTEWPCEPYRLAAGLAAANRRLAAATEYTDRLTATIAARDDALAAVQDREQRVRNLVEDWHNGPYLTVDTADDFSEMVLAALAGEGTTDQPQDEVCGKAFSFWSNCELPPHGPEVQCSGRTVFERDDR